MSRFLSRFPLTRSIYVVMHHRASGLCRAEHVTRLGTVDNRIIRIVHRLVQDTQLTTTERPAKVCQHGNSTVRLDHHDAPEIEVCE